MNSMYYSDGGVFLFHKFTLSQSWQKYIFKIIAFLFMCKATLFFLTCIAAFMITRIDTPEYVLIPLTTILLVSSSFIDSFLIAKTMKENGILTGLIIGVIFSVIILLLALYHGTLAFTGVLISKTAAAILSGILGGILGVNC